MDIQRLKVEIRTQIIEEGNGSHTNPESWIELKVKNLDNAIAKAFALLGADE